MRYNGYMAKLSSGVKAQKTPLYGKAEKPTYEGEGVAKTATNWLLFWLVAGVGIAKDLLDIVWSAVEALGVALTATVVGAVVGIPISFFAIGLSWMVSLTVFIITMVYFVYTKQSVMLRLVIMSISTIIGMIPIFKILPEATIGFFVGAFVATIAKTGKKIIGGVTGGAKKIIMGN